MRAIPVLATTLLVGCTSVAPEPLCPRSGSVATPSPSPGASSSTAMLFASAMRDAITAEASEISTELAPLVDANPRLVWKGVAPDRKLLFVTWTAWTGYDDAVGTQLSLQREVWATPAPDLQEFCHSHFGSPAPSGDALAPASVLRLEQLLGLREGGKKDRFVEMWVDPTDVFRPCPDPETTDRECSLDFPRATRFVAVSEDHVKWFESRRKASYGEDGYPWTRLGYTYDWGNTESHVGLSEFVIREGATVEIKAVSKNAAYCR